MKTQKEQLSEKILDYWFALEFLSQDRYPDFRDIQNRVKKRKKDVRVKIKEGKNNLKTIETFITFTGENLETDLFELACKEAAECGMKLWGNFTVYIGKVKREKCISCIAAVLPVSEEDSVSPEKNTDEIAWASLQLSPSGDYLKYSLSLSTIIWALNQIKHAKGDLSESLDDRLYHEAVETLEKTLPEGRFSLKSLRTLYEKIEETYIKGNIENTGSTNDAYEEIYGISFQLFADEEAKNKKEEDSYLGLSHDYFSDDIKLVLEQVRSGALSDDRYLGKELLSYITVLQETEHEKDRIDLVAPKKQGSKEYKRQISEILLVENAPLGKWPSRFMPAFMQQIAINLSIGKGTSALYGENGRVFSVNGPPGTGKTTLLKEIVVSNIVERAILLSAYDEPDKAFRKHDFLHGGEAENAYSKYTRHWYSLENDAVNDYSMLVTSCNNAAVENISKELPKGMLGDLTPLAEDTEELKALLTEVGDLFDPEKSETVETTDRDKVHYHDIYYTKYAKDLLDSEDVWGLVAAPLGKKSNLDRFYSRVLYPLGWDFYKSKDMAQKRCQSYRAARERFLKQLDVVKDMQASLKKAGELAEKRARAEELVCQIRTECEAEIEESARNIKIYQEKLSALQSEQKTVLLRKESCEKALHEVTAELQRREEQLKQVNEEVKELREKAWEVSRSVGIVTKLFRKAEYHTALQLADTYTKEAEEQSCRAAALKAEVESAEKRVEPAQNLYDRISLEYEEGLAVKDRLAQSMVEQDDRIVDCRKKLALADEALAAVIKEYEAETARFTGGDVLEQAQVIDSRFIGKLLSDDIQETTQAQVSNPWFTQRYNREREKLFGYAMRLNKEFVISSNRCRDNLVTLSHYWGLRQGDEGERINFHEEDKENMLPALFQTLFLLVPVISSTFASVGSLLRDIRKTGVIGTLVVDEAGQAQPQMALGALFRSRRAVIVGDPKQVEPVVTDDLLLLRKAYTDDVLRPYKKKTLSVQRFADGMNRFGTYLDNGSDYPDWAGCPLLVHRRCISPMYDISNEISYNGIMKQQTRPPKPAQAAKFICGNSQWIQVKGKENGSKDHFVKEQGRKVCELLETAFSNNPEPSLYIISPFTTVVSGIKKYIESYCRMHPQTKIKKEYMLDYEKKKIGTVHTFQGKEADEVIFLLGCDDSAEAGGAVKWVNRNIVNVAATRAKFRLYVIGDEETWQASQCVSMAKEILDTYAIKEIKSILDRDISEQEREEALLKASAGLPPVTSFATVVSEEGDGDYSLDTAGFIKGLDETFLKTELSTEQLGEFGFTGMQDLEVFSAEVRANIILGMKLFFLLGPVYRLNKQMDASCCAILFCKALELQIKDCFAKGLKEALPECRIGGNGQGSVLLKDAKSRKLMLGTFGWIFRNYKEELSRRMEMAGYDRYDALWWSAFEEKLGECTRRRNKCCHAGLFEWEEQVLLLDGMFKADLDGQEKRKIGGIMFESEIGRKLGKNK